MGERRRDVLLSSARSKNEFCAFTKSLMSEYGATFGDFKGVHGKKLIAGVSELLQEINHKQIESLWSSISELTIDALQCISGTLNTDECEESDQMDTDSRSDSLDVLQGVCLIILSNVKLEPTVTKDLVQALTLLHGSIFDLHAVSHALGSCICVICEEWWKKNLESREMFCLNTITHLLRLFLQFDKKEKLHSIYQMQSCLSLFDFKKKQLPGEGQDALTAATVDEYDQETVEELRSLVLTCFLHTSVLKDSDGRQFLSNVMLLHKDLMKDAHIVVTDSIKPTSVATKVEALGFVYFQAWRFASDEKKEHFEDVCIQDVMYRAVHAPRTKINDLFVPFRLMLNAIVSNKGATEVRHMVTRLYSPILWRSLKANNAMVRANAASLLIDAFPLEEEDSNRPRLANNEEFIQRQYEALDSMLLDDYPRIRVIGILGLCDILRTYWDIIPASVIAILSRKLFNDLAFDSAVSVRQAVFQGAIILLDTPCSHMLLGKLLPGCVEKCIHDVSEKVRIAVADTLLAIKQTSTVSFWSVCPIQNIMAQLEVDNVPSVSKRLVKLLFRSFVPETDSKNTWVERCVSFYKKRVKAARKFYLLIEDDITLQETGEFLNLIGTFIYNCVSMTLQQENTSPTELEASSQDETGDENTSQKKNPTIDAEIIAALLETSCILWKSLNRRMSTSKGRGGREREMMKTIMVSFSRALHVCFKIANDERSLNAILLLSSHLPPASLPVFSISVLPKLRSLSDDTPDSHYSMLIECVCAWDWTKQILELIRDWLLEATGTLEANQVEKSAAKDGGQESNIAEGGSTRRSVRLSKAPDQELQKDDGMSGKRKKKKKRVMFTGIRDHEARPGQAIKYLSCFLDIQSAKSFPAIKQTGCHEVLVSIAENLEKCQAEILKRISSRCGGQRPWTDELLVKAIDARLNLVSILHLHEKPSGASGEPGTTSTDSEQKGSLETVFSVVDWFGDVIKMYEASSRVKLNTSVLAAEPAGLLSNLSLYRTVFNTCLSACLDFLSCGIQIFERVEETLVKFCNSGVNLIEHVGYIIRLIFQLHQHKVKELAPEVTEAHEEGSMSETLKVWSEKNKNLIQIFDCFISVLLQHARQNSDNFLQVFRHDVRTSLRTLIKEQHFLHSICPQRAWYDVITRKALSAVLADLFSEIRSGFSKRDRIVDLPAFSANVLSVLCTTSAECRHVCEIGILHLSNDENTFAIEQRDSMLLCFAHLLYTLSKDGKDKESANFCIAEMSKLPGFRQIVSKIEAGEDFDTDVEPGGESTRKEEMVEEGEVPGQEEIVVLEAPEEQGMLVNDEEFVL